MNKKALHPVVAVSLLIVMSVLTVVAFQVWYNNYQSGLQNNAESQGTNNIQTKIDDVIGSELYFKNGFDESLEITDIKVNGTSCSINGTYGTGIQTINISSCNTNLTGAVEIVVFTNQGIFTKEEYFSKPLILSTGPVIIYSSCLDLLNNEPSTSSGYYTIDVDGEGVGNDSFEVYCDMDVDGGGWTLVGSKFVNSFSIWTYANREYLWNNTPFGDINDALINDTKNPAWYLLKANEILFINASDSNMWISFNSMLQNETVKDEMYQYPRTETESSYPVYKNNSIGYECNLRTYGYSSAGSCSTGNKVLGFHKLHLGGFGSCNFNDYESGVSWICNDAVGTDCCGTNATQEQATGAYFRNELVFVR